MRRRRQAALQTPRFGDFYRLIMYQNATSDDRLATANHRLVGANHRLAAANHRLAGANYGLAAAYDRLVGANETQQRQMQGEMTFASAACGSMRLIKSSLAVRPGDIGRWNDGLLRLLVRS